MRAPSRKKSLALSVYFQQPDFGMKEPEILSRATAFLLGIDSSAPKGPEGPYSHLEKQKEASKDALLHNLSAATPSKKGQAMAEMRWLEFVPREVRPQVHVVASSHVLSPFLWKNYYPQDWLSQVRQEHCSYTLEVMDADHKSLAKLALSSHPYHHPEGLDVGLIHFREEKSSLQILQKLGVEILHMRDPDKLYQKGETMFFDGFVVSEPNTADKETLGDNTEAVNEDNRIFYPYRETGTLAFHTNERFFATTPEPLPEGLCGAPTIDADGDLCGMVEGIVPVSHKDERLAGAAAFLPSPVLIAFVDYVERALLQQMMPKELFDMVVEAKQTNTIGDGSTANVPPSPENDDGWNETYDKLMNVFRQRYSPEEMSELLKSVKKERDEVLKIFDEEGGDMDEIIQRVRSQSLEVRELIKDQYQKSAATEEVEKRQA